MQMFALVKVKQIIIARAVKSDLSLSHMPFHVFIYIYLYFCIAVALPKGNSALFF